MRERERASERKCGIEAPRNSGRKSNVNEPNERVHSWTARTEIAAFNFFLSCIGADFQMLNSDPKEETKQQNQKKTHRKLLNQFCNTPIFQPICFMCWNPKPKWEREWMNEIASWEKGKMPKIRETRRTKSNLSQIKVATCFVSVWRRISFFLDRSCSPCTASLYV